MRNASRRLQRIASVLSGAALAAWLATGPAVASDTTKVGGTITDGRGEPLAKVEVYFENAAIKGKRVGPVKTNKKGRYIHPFLDVGIEPEWRVVPQMPGYMVLKVSWKQIDSQRQDRGSNEITLNSKQEFPVLRPVMVGTDGVNEVNFVMVKEEDFANALREAGSQKQGGGTPAAAGEAVPAPALAAVAPGAPPPAPPSARGVSDALDLMKSGKPAEAIPLLQAYLEKNPNNAPLQYTLGKAFVDTKQYDLAVPPLTKSLTLEPNHAGSHFYLGIVYNQMGQDEEALKEFLAEIPNSPDQDTNYSNAASIYEKQQKWDKALEYYQKAVEINPKRAELHASLARIYEKKGDQAKAEIEYKTLADVDPANASVTWFNIGAIAKNNDKNDDAVHAFRKAVELDPKYALAHRELGYALVKQGDFAQAVVHMKKYLDLAPRAPDAAQIRDMVKQLSR